jgi:hypothetical protein
MSKYKWQHYVPQMYLAAWVDPERVQKGQHDLWVYRPGEPQRPRGPKGLGAQVDLYTTKEIEDDPRAAEKGLGEIESEAVKIVEQLRAGDIGLSPDAKSEFAIYLGLQVFRTPLAFARSNAVAIELMRQGWKKTLDEGGLPKLVAELDAESGESNGSDLEALKAYGKRIADGTLELVQQSTGWNVFNMLERGGELGAILARMHWALLEAADGRAFVTSDNPVHIADPPAKDAGPKGFRFSNRMQFACPISPRYLLLGDFADRTDETAKLDEFQTWKFNEDQIEFAFREVYASFASDALRQDVDKIFADRAPVIPRLPPGMLE